LKAPGDPTLEPIKWIPGFKVCLFKCNLYHYVTVVSGRGGKTGLPDMYFGNASIGGAVQVECSWPGLDPKPT
jgi:hypothetical protein